METYQALNSAICQLAQCHVDVAIDSIDCRDIVMPEELQLVAFAVDKRRREFAAGRRCARIALSAAGAMPAAIGKGHFGEPLWPKGFQGSITHTDKVAAALVRRDGHHVLNFGLDLLDEQSWQYLPAIANAFMRAEINRNLGAAADEIENLAQWFSAKEAVIKILSPRWATLVDPKLIDLIPSDCGYLARYQDEPTGVVVRCRLAYGFAIAVAVHGPVINPPGIDLPPTILAKSTSM